jgi:protein-L-isoaspartate O-methyltransferase
VATLESFQKQYDTTTAELVVRDRSFRFFVPERLDPFVDPEDLFQDFPLWIKIWEASFVLAEYLAGFNVESGKRFLEIGCGLGVVGIVTSSFGHHVTMTEYNHDALNFARANALLNEISSNLEIRHLDWNSPLIEGSFDYIVGSEILFREGDFDPLFKLLMTYLNAGGEVILAEGIRKTSMEFMRQMSHSFSISAKKKILRSGDQEIPIMLSRMKLKKSARRKGFKQ